MGSIVQPDLLRQDKAITSSNMIHCKTPACETTAQQKSCAGDTMANRHISYVWHLRTAVTTGLCYPSLLLALCISLKWHRTQTGEKPPWGLPQRAGRQPVYGAKCNPDQRGATGKKRKSMVTHEETRRDKGKKTSVKSCREVLPEKGRSQATAQLFSKSLLRCATWSWLAGVQYLAGPLAGPAGSACFQEGWRPTASSRPQCPAVDLPGSPACRCSYHRQHSASHQFLAPSTRARQEEVQANRQHILHCLNCSVLTTCPVCYETNLMEEMNGILLLKALCQAH